MWVAKWLNRSFLHASESHWGCRRLWLPMLLLLLCLVLVARNFCCHFVVNTHTHTHPYWHTHTPWDTPQRAEQQQFIQHICLIYIYNFSHRETPRAQEPSSVTPPHTHSLWCASVCVCVCIPVCVYASVFCICIIGGNESACNLHTLLRHPTAIAWIFFSLSFSLYAYSPSLFILHSTISPFYCAIVEHF